MIAVKIPAQHTAAYLAASHLHASGPKVRSALFSQVNFGLDPLTRKEKMFEILAAGWLVESAGVIDLSPAARKYFDALAAPEPEYKGEVAAPRSHSGLYGPALSAKHVPSSKGFRDDIPEYSQRPADFHHRTVG